MKRIAIDARMMQASGIGTVIQNVLRRLIKERPDWLFYVLGKASELMTYPWLNSDNVKCIYTEVPIYSLTEQLRIPSLIPSDTDLLWVPHYNIPVLYRGKMIVTVHDCFHLAMPEFVSSWHKRFYAKALFKAVAKKAQQIVCVSDFTRQELIRFTQVNQDKVHTIYNGVDAFWSQPSKNQQRLYQKPYILYVGNVKPHKNLRRLVEAFKQVAQQIPQDLLIVGKKEGFITGDAAVAQLAIQMEDRIRFTGFVSNEDLKNYYHYADMLVFPSLYEGFGLPPLEARKAGCQRIIVSDIPVLHEVYGDRVSYFNPRNIGDMAEKIQSELVQSKEQEVIEPSFDWDRCTKQYMTVIEQCLTD